MIIVKIQLPDEAFSSPEEHLEAEHETAEEIRSNANAYTAAELNVAGVDLKYAPTVEVFVV